jgi:hypothetical protein
VDGADDRGHVEGVVQAPVVAAVEPVAHFDA